MASLALLAAEVDYHSSAYRSGHLVGRIVVLLVVAAVAVALVGRLAERDAD